MHRILLVDGREGDAELIQRAFAEASPHCRVRVVGDGETALELLLGGDVPDLLLIDLDAPGLSGHELLVDLRARRDARLRRLPVVVLSNTAAPDDVRRSYDLFANSHVVKPRDPDEMAALATLLARYWLDTVSLP
jgi:chemotaxis family two-component system response regulator Rcp1